MMASAEPAAAGDPQQIASAVDLIVQIERMRDGIRRVVQIVEIAGMEGEVITTRDLFTFELARRGARRQARGELRADPAAPRPRGPRGAVRPRKAAARNGRDRRGRMTAPRR